MAQRAISCGLGLRTQASRNTGVSPYFLVYGSEAVLPMDIAFWARRVEHYNEEQAAAVRANDVDRAKEEYYNRNIKGRSFVVDDLVLHRKQKTKGMHKFSSP